MREIKFRAWDKIKKEIHDEVYITQFEIMSHLEGIGHYVALDIDRCELMQYTGVKDYTGREIYEGDLYEDEENMLWQIKFIDGVFILTNVDIPAYHYVTILNKRDTFKHVGNIYENKDLLEDIE